MTGLFEDLNARGLVEQISAPELGRLLDQGALTAYVGFDPTATSLHVGSLVPILGLVRLQRAGHRPIALVGGATGMIGDPSGKSQERQLLSPDQLAENVGGVQRQLERFLDFSGERAARVVNNADWFAGVGFIDFLRDVGKHFSVNAMIARESVRARLEEREQGISFTEFSYQLLQAYDFLWLYENLGCTLQLGGSDQWGNITAGIDLIRRKKQQVAYGCTMPLITTSEGKKFGKSEQGNVWLDPERTSPYRFYQFFLNTDDRDVGRFLRYFTFLSLAELTELERRRVAEPERREAQRVLAREVTRLVHGEDEARKAEAAAVALFGGTGDRGGVNVAAVLEAAVAAGAPFSTLLRTELPGLTLVHLLSREKVNLCASLGAARREIAGGGIYLNEERVGDAARLVTEADFVDGKLLLRKGKKNYHIVQLAEFVRSL